eukprot:13959928-Alexandrium_andersonii.AAC.1
MQRRRTHSSADHALALLIAPGRAAVPWRPAAARRALAVPAARLRRNCRHRLAPDGQDLHQG